MSEESQAEQISADGRWRWDGKAWQPVEAAPAPTPPVPPPSPAISPSSPTPNPAARPRSGPSWPAALLMAAAALVFGGICGIGVGSSSQSHNNTTGGVANQSANQAPTPAASRVPSPSPQVLLNLSGSGTKTTQKFTTSGDDWDLVWTYNCASFGGSGNFIVMVKNGDGSPSDNQGVNQLGANGSDTEHFHSGGTFYLQVISECSWTVKAIG